MVDIEFTYSIDAVPQTDNYTNVTVIPNFAVPQVVLIFPQSSNDYDALYDNMINPPTDMKIKFTGFGAVSEYQDLVVTRTVHMKSVDPTFNILHNITITLEQIAE